MLERIGEILGIATVSSASVFFATGEIKSIIITCIGMAALVTYELMRKFKKEAITGPWDFLDRNFVRLILGAVVAPNAVRSILDLLGMAF